MLALQRGSLWRRANRPVLSAAEGLVKVVSGTITTTFAYPSEDLGQATATGTGCARSPTA
jgi:hypothetical protein